MPKYVKVAGWVLLGLLFVGGVLGWRFLSAAGYFTAIRQEVPADCQAVASVPGPEDIIVDHKNNVAFVSALDRRAIMATSGKAGDAIRGGIYVIDLTQPVDQWQLAPVTPAEPAALRPHGIDLYEGEDGSRRLFVVNHAPDGTEAVLIYDVAEDNSLTLVKSVTSSLLVSPNDVVAVGPESFYVTNDHGAKPGLARTLEDILLLRNGSVVYFDGSKMSQAADRLSYPNGINVSDDGRHIYVASTLGMALHVYDRDVINGSIKAVDYARLGTGVDNIDVLPDGSLLMAAHPHIVDFVSHSTDPDALSPSQVVRVALNENGGGGEAGTIYLNLGEELSGISVAAGYKDLMLLGNVFSSKILVCQQSTEIKAY